MSGGFKADEISQPVVEKRQVTRAIHPEMADVKNGDELMVVKFRAGINRSYATIIKESS